MLKESGYTSFQTVKSLGNKEKSSLSSLRRIVLGVAALLRGVWLPDTGPGCSPAHLAWLGDLAGPWHCSGMPLALGMAWGCHWPLAGRVWCREERAGGKNAALPITCRRMTGAGWEKDAISWPHKTWCSVKCFSLRNELWCGFFFLSFFFFFFSSRKFTRDLQ